MNIGLPPLYMKSSAGKLKVWQARAIGPSVIVSHGYVGGKIQTKSTTSEPKNIGKSNETTAEEQAKKDAESKFRKQLLKGYKINPDDVDEIIYKPMLAKDYRTLKSWIYPCYLQPKLDGVRCLIRYNKADGKIIMTSRGGKTYKNIPQIDSAVEPILKANPKLILDGELYIHGVPLETIQRAVKKHNKDTPTVVFWCFDVIDLAQPDQIFKDRYMLLKALGSEYTKGAIDFLKCVKAYHEDDMKHFHEICVENGFEGVILRRPDEAYRFNYKSKGLAKYKEFEDAEYKLLAVSVDKVGSCKLHFEHETERFGKVPFEASYKGTVEQRQHIAQNPQLYIGKWFTVKYQTVTPYGSLQFPVAINIRDIINGEVQE